MPRFRIIRVQIHVPFCPLRVLPILRTTDCVALLMFTNFLLNDPTREGGGLEGGWWLSFYRDPYSEEGVRRGIMFVISLAIEASCAGFLPFGQPCSKKIECGSFFRRGHVRTFPVGRGFF